ncbi:MAG: hypothetical protein ABIG95_05130 [Candidatus Woesearchaeota archaeon]
MKVKSDGILCPSCWMSIKYNKTTYNTYLNAKKILTCKNCGRQLGKNKTLTVEKQLIIRKLERE